MEEGRHGGEGEHGELEERHGGELEHGELEGAPGALYRYTSSFFTLSPSHQFLRHIHGALKVGKKITNCIVW
jgi:hypothetical protein